MRFLKTEMNPLSVEQIVLLSMLGSGLLAYITINLLNRFRKRKIKRKEWEENKLMLFLLLIQSITVVLSIIVNSIFRSPPYPVAIIEYIINFILFFLSFIESLHLRRIPLMTICITLLLLFLLSH
ncbi:MAG: hypothetical protein QXP92_03390 [Nitrososphaerota archaeon]